jgi:hypothetical protein
MAESRKHTLLENLAFASSLRALLCLELCRFCGGNLAWEPFASAPYLKTFVQNFASEQFLASLGKNLIRWKSKSGFGYS